MTARRVCFALAIAATLFACMKASAADFTQRWLMYGTDLSKPEEVDKAVAMMKEAKDDGCTHILFGEPITTEILNPTPEYRAAAKRIVDAAKAQGLELVPGIFAIGYSGRYILRDPNLAAGLPVKNAPFIVKDGVAWPDPANGPKLTNPGFEDVVNGKPAGWVMDGPAGKITADSSVKHSGASSLKVSGLGRGANQAYAKQTLKVTPFQYYRVTVWVKTKGMRAEGESYINVHNSEGTRHLSYTNLEVKEDEDWTKHETVFNSLDATSVEFWVGAAESRGGTIWFDDLTLEPAGLLNVVVREATPFKVTSADGSVTYTEGRDYDPIIPSTANEIYKRVAVARPLILPLTTRIKDGERLLISYFHTVLIYDDQIGCSMEDPKVFEMMETQMKNTAEIWQAKEFMMNYDEIRMGGWENQPGGAHMKPGELLANHITKAVSIIRKYVPDAKLYVWSDMFTPEHNAYSFEQRHRYYYLVNGNWDGSWNGLPMDIVILNWSCNAADLKWFADRGHEQVIAGYYDGDPKESVDAWMTASKGIPRITGIMYCTWHDNYKDMATFFSYAQTYGQKKTGK